MATIRPSVHKLGELTTLVFDYPKAGDILPLHNHEQSDVHISIIARGSFHVTGTNLDMVATTGQILDWEPGQEHQLVALEDNSRLVNVRKFPSLAVDKAAKEISV